MAELLLTGEVLLGLVLLLALVAVALVLRRVMIARGGPIMLVGTQRSSGSWVMGMARVAPSDIAWFRLVGVTTRPKVRWTRGDLELGVPEKVEHGRPVVITDPVSVLCHANGTDLRIVLSAGDYTALRSWSESAPPGLNANVA